MMTTPAIIVVSDVLAGIALECHDAISRAYFICAIIGAAVFIARELR